MKIRRFKDSNKEDLIGLWKVVFPDDSHHERFEVIAGYDGHYDGLYAVAVLSMHHRGGTGLKLVKYAMHSLKELGRIKINLQVCSITAEAAAFYKLSGFSAVRYSCRQDFYKCIKACIWRETKLEKSKTSFSIRRER
ncbi:MAG: hypothetical protein PHY16_17870 [Methylobacter sp.]|nr:hypothetical protein [Methylobacter sp.]